MFDRKFFFTNIHSLDAHFTQTQVSGFEAILAAWEKYGLTDTRWLAYMLATAWHETAATMQPIAEYGHGKGRAYGTPDPVTGKVYYGRGYVQLTWKANYATMSKVCGADLVKDPEMALDPETASLIMFNGMVNGTFTGKKLSTYFNGVSDDPEGARRIINGTDKASLISGYHKVFLAALKKDASLPQVPPQKPALPTPPATMVAPTKTTDKPPTPVVATPAPTLGFWARFFNALRANQERTA